MIIKTKGKAVELMNKSIPYSHQISNIDLDSCEDAIYFDWRDFRYKLEFSHCAVYVVKGGCLIGDDNAILMEHCLKQRIGEIL